MSIEHENNIYPNCPYINRTVVIEGLTKAQLMLTLQEHSILMNKYGEMLLIDDHFTPSNTKYLLQTVELTVGDLGYINGATTAQIFKRAFELGLELCPLELAPYLRIQYLDQPEGYLGDSIKRPEAPSGSITIASEPITEDDEYPKGFYLRRINGELWLRGYRADHLHVWNSGDHFIFCQTN